MDDTALIVKSEFIKKARAESTRKLVQTALVLLSLSVVAQIAYSYLTVENALAALAGASNAVNWINFHVSDNKAAYISLLVGAGVARSIQ